MAQGRKAGLPRELGEALGRRDVARRERRERCRVEALKLAGGRHLLAGPVEPEPPEVPDSGESGGLTTGAGRHGAIHGVIGLITDIAARTSLSALDATVAATETEGQRRRASDRLEVEMGADGDILDPQIGAIRAATEQAIGTIESVGAAVNELNALVAAIASRVELDGRDDVGEGRAQSGTAALVTGHGDAPGEVRLGDTVHAVCSRIARLQSELVRIRDLAPLRDAA